MGAAITQGLDAPAGDGGQGGKSQEKDDGHQDGQGRHLDVEGLDLSKTSAGPPPGDLDTRSITAAISRSGLTGSTTWTSSLRRSSSAMKDVMSGNI